MDTIELKIDVAPKEPWTGILIAELSELGFDGFMETKTGLLAYAPVNVDADKAIDSCTSKYSPELKCKVEKNIIPYQNWNAQWEGQFEPVYLDEKAAIVAPFHDNVRIEGMKVVIEPQMSFGTGHHQTTWLMSRALFDLNEMPKHILDMGSGTGVLAIIAEKLGAQHVLAVDIEEEAKKNIEHNVALNACSFITALCGDIDCVDQELRFGLILANINKNVLKSHMKYYWNLLEGGGQLWLSGFFQSDVDELRQFAESIGFTYKDEQDREGWALLMLVK